MSVRSPSNVQPPLSTPSYQPVTQSKTQGGYVSKVGEIMGTSLSAGPQGSPGILRKNSITDSLTEPASNWRVDELLNLADLAEDWNAANMGSSKVLCCNLWCCCKLLMPWFFCFFYTVNWQQELLLLDFWWHNLAFRMVYCMSEHKGCVICEYLYVETVWQICPRELLWWWNACFDFCRLMLQLLETSIGHLISAYLMKTHFMRFLSYHHLQLLLGYQDPPGWLAPSRTWSRK